MPNTPKLPEYARERIYLQPNSEDPSETTWCADNIGDDDIEYVRADVFAQELSTLKAQVRKEIEELKREHKPCYGKSACDCPGCIAESVHNQTLDDCLSIASLKGEE